MVCMHTYYLLIVTRCALKPMKANRSTVAVQSGVNGGALAGLSETVAARRANVLQGGQRGTKSYQCSIFFGAHAVKL
jgi:hypothetical protein